MPSPAIRLEFPAPDIALLTFDDPHRRVNVLARDVLDTFEQLLDTLAARADVADLAGLVVRSGKSGSFLAGADVHDLARRVATAGGSQIEAACRRVQTLFGRLATFPFPTVAAVAGTCLGGGTELASWCDRRVVADAGVAGDPSGETTIGCPEVQLGMFPGWGGTVRLPRLIGLGPAVDLITTGEPIAAAAAVRLGWADDHAAPAELLDAAIALARREQASGAYRVDRERRDGAVSIPDAERDCLATLARARIRHKTKGRDPAPERALELILEGSRLAAAAACQLEAARLGAHWGCPTHRALVHVFLLREWNRKVQPVPSDVRPAPPAIASVGVIGAGIMGGGIAAVSLRRDLQVTLFDSAPESLARGAERVRDDAAYDKQRKGPDPIRRAALTARLRVVDNLEGLAEQPLVVEAIVENAEAKRELFQRLEPLVAADAILASNTSTIPITRQAAHLRHPERFCGMHFFNPVRILPLVEIIRGAATSDDTVARAVAFARRIGKSPIVVNDGPGFLVNRVLFPYLNESLQLASEGVPLEEIESAAIDFGMPMGPLELYDMVGIDTALFAGRVIWSAFLERVQASPILPALLKAGRLGQKSGAGFFRYPAAGPASPGSGRQPDPALDAVIGDYLAPNRSAPRSEIVDRLLFPMLFEAARALEDRIVDDPRAIDFGVMHGLGFPAFRGGLMFWADQEGLAEILRRNEPFLTLGPRYEPPPLLRELAARHAPLHSLVPADPPPP
jgi:3-hydroxyacyl-CoA dehydrogenase/enoyl-CoA hydratase/3-hydroxybutyryl-CoA epimerase/3-hydroxyacyl-CoA dehydrogenase/enoyl-CoA hydratase/3-hydroxybutyryl-CoA epimerase/enoyl-CoA isomerase